MFLSNYAPDAPVGGLFNLKSKQFLLPNSISGQSLGVDIVIGGVDKEHARIFFALYIRLD